MILPWRHNERDSVSNHQPRDCLLNRLFRRRPKKTSKLRVTGLFEGNSPVTGELPTQRSSNTENVSICWRHHENLRHWEWWVYALKPSDTIMLRQNGFECNGFCRVRCDVITWTNVGLAIRGTINYKLQPNLNDDTTIFNFEDAFWKSVCIKSAIFDFSQEFNILIIHNHIHVSKQSRWFLHGRCIYLNESHMASMVFLQFIMEIIIDNHWHR